MKVLHIYIYTYIYSYIYAHTHTHAHAHTHMHTHIIICMYVHVYVQLYVIEDVAIYEYSVNYLSVDSLKDSHYRRIWLDIEVCMYVCSLA